MFARVNTFQGSPKDVEASAKNVQDYVLPAVKQVPGFAGMIALTDRATGKAIGITLWESEDALSKSEQAASTIRQRSSEAPAATIVSVERYEVTELVLEGQAAPTA
jgi:heme-degrading monooxygenase HmoA